MVGGCGGDTALDEAMRHEKQGVWVTAIRIVRRSKTEKMFRFAEQRNKKVESEAWSWDQQGDLRC